MRYQTNFGKKAVSDWEKQTGVVAGGAGETRSLQSITLEGTSPSEIVIFLENMLRYVSKSQDFSRYSKQSDRKSEQVFVCVCVGGGGQNI